jgi:excisionase family DNA binding protein
MAQEYLTLEEAARKLGLPTEELTQMRERKEIRGFADRGTWRFRAQDIEELARRRGLGSNPDLPLADVPKPHDSPAPRKAVPKDEGSITFPLGGDSDQVEIGRDMMHTPTPSSRSHGSRSSSGSGSRSPSPKPGSDSDVRLVADGSDVGFQIASDSDVKLEDVPSGLKTPKPKKRPPGASSDSDVKIVADSSGEIDISSKSPKPKKPSDSDVRLEQSVPGPAARKGGEESFLTEEIDLDAELRKAEEASHKRAASKSKAPGSSPFELSDPDLPATKTPKKSAAKQSTDSSDFDLALDSADLSPLEPSSGDVDLGSQRGDEVALGEIHPAGVTGASDSGINLQEPSDRGISLEPGDSSQEIEFELSLDAESTPKPAKAKPNVDSSSEFELTLEDSAQVPAAEQATSAMPVQEEKDIFETDFDVPALEDSSSQALPLEDSDTDLESSDFDLALSDADMVAEEESGSQVVALEDEEQVDESAATVARPRGRFEEGEESGEFAPEEVEALGGIEKEASSPALAMAAAPQDWGTFVPVTLMVSTFVMFFVAIMSFELLHGMWGYHQPNRASNAVIRMVGGLVPTIDSKDLEKD